MKLIFFERREGRADLVDEKMTFLKRHGTKAAARTTNAEMRLTIAEGSTDTAYLYRTGAELSTLYIFLCISHNLPISKPKQLSDLIKIQESLVLGNWAAVRDAAITLAALAADREQNKSLTLLV